MRARRLCRCATFVATTSTGTPSGNPSATAATRILLADRAGLPRPSFGGADDAAASVVPDWFGQSPALQRVTIRLMPTAILTGSGGLVGSERVQHFVEAGFDVIAPENDTRARFFGPSASTSRTTERLKRIVRCWPSSCARRSRGRS